MSKIVGMEGRRESGRLREVQQRRVLDDASRVRRQRKALEALEHDNFQEDPHADLKMSKKAPKFEETIDVNSQTSKKKRKTRVDFKQRFRKNFSALLEEEQMLDKPEPNYISAQAPSSILPDRHFCAICGYFSNYTCVACGTRYCSVRCLGTHQDTRCLKWTA